MAGSPGYTPFSFSSKKTQDNTVGLLNLVPGMGGVLGSITTDILSQLLAWYEMWVNPEKIDMKYQYVQATKQTAGALITFHYHRQNINMSVSGQSGWILNPTAGINSQYKDAATKYLQDGNIGKSIATSVRGTMKQVGIPGASPHVGNFSQGAPIGAARSKDRYNNSARIFLQRIRDIANEPMYYVDIYGVEHYNTKYIKIYTKQFPKGVICEGYFTDFSIPESKDDCETIAYSFSFVVENLAPISAAQQILGKYAGKATGTGSVIRSVTGVL